MKRCAVLAIVVLAALSLGAALVSAQSEDGAFPQYAVGDYWKFSYDAKEEIGLFGSLIITVTADAQVLQQFGVAYTCYELDVAGGGAVYGELEGRWITGNWTLAGKTYLETNGLHEVKSVLTTNATIATSAASVFFSTATETTYNPPLESLKVPLTFGSSWSATTNETTTTTLTINGQTSTEVNSTIHTVQYAVVRTEVRKLPAGEFETHVVQYSAVNGSSGEYYFAPQARYSIIENTYSPSGELTRTSELMEYGRASRTFIIPPLILVPSVTAAGVAVGVAAYLLYTRRARQAGATRPAVT
jgi:hypothetical protein